MEIFQLDQGTIPDSVVDSLSEIRNWYRLNLFRINPNPIRLSFWPEEDLDKIVFHLSVLQGYFGPIFGLNVAPPDKSVAEAVSGALARKSRAF